MVEPNTAIPVSEPPTAAERSGYRSPPIATIIGKMGPAAAPAAANARIDSGRLGARTAIAMQTAMPMAEATVNRTWSNRSEITDETRRPTVRPAQNSDRARVAVVRGA